MDRRIGGWMAAMAVAGGMAAATPASAGTYNVYACATPAGKFTNHSWMFEVAGPATQFQTGTCSDQDAIPSVFLNSEANKTYDPGWRASMTFAAPTGARIANFSIHRFLFQFNPVDDNPGRAMLYDLGQLGPTPFELTGQHSASTVLDSGHWYAGGQAATDERTITPASFPALAGYTGTATYLRWTIGCEAAQGCALWTNHASPPQAGSILAQIFGATVTVNDPTNPTVSAVAGTGLTAGGVVGGDEPVTFDAADNSGIKSIALMDVTPGEAEQVLATREFACDYSYAAPCPQPNGARIVPAGLKAGTRLLRLRVNDAGNNGGESAAFPVRVGGAANGAPADAGAKLSLTFARNRRGTITVGFGKRASIRGRLTTAGGAPIAGATLQLLDRELKAGTSYRPRTEVTTGADGSFTVLPGPGAARAIRLEYRSRKLLASPDVVGKAELRVRAGATLTISPKRVRPRGTITISGRLRGTPLPRSGKVVDLQALEGGKWRTFDTTRARKGARFRTTYRFLRARSGASFEIRARVRRDDSYPYYLGYSPRVRVRVR